MKRLLIYAAAAMTVMACTAQSSTGKFAAYETAYDSIMEAYRNEAITDAEAESRIIDLSIETIRKNPKDSVALKVFKKVYYLFDNEQLGTVLSSIKGDLAGDSFVGRMKAGLDAKLNTVEGKMFTDFTIVQDPDDAAGTSVKLSDYVGRGKYVLVDFWASWCVPCTREIPNIASVYEKYHGDSFDVLSVAVWDEPADTKAAAAEHGVVWNQIINAQSIPTDLYGIDGIPHIMLFGPDGTIVKRELRGEAIGAAVAEALGL